MVDGKCLGDQVQELEVMFHEIHVEGMMLSEGFQVTAIIEKLPPSWKDFKNYLKHKRKEMAVKELALRLHIEEDNRNAGVVSALPNPSVGEVKANVIEQGISSKKEKKSNFALRGPFFKRNGHNSKGATRHVCSVKEHFTTYKKITNGEKMYMENSASSTIEGEGSVVLKMTSRKQVTLNKVLHVLELRKNSVSGFGA
ncbi:hypothetical protein LIER_41586 [Lithospermum erythrorhizon]|uniref:Retrovirus-related Pol polyprotein from transposon TNT 1-94-like beta-barrel domain-containing protein n=1 Tax=Lithospermum erythrorhizon TaxID=34254 RepID=A0AAV3RCT9_LITER